MKTAEETASQLALEFEKLQSDRTLSFDGYWKRINELILESFKSPFKAGHDFAMDCEKLGADGNIDIAFKEWINSKTT